MKALFPIEWRRVPGHEVVGRIDAMFRTALGRPPHQEERERFSRFAAEVAALHNVPADSVLTSSLVWRDMAHALFNLQEFISIP